MVGMPAVKDPIVPSRVKAPKPDTMTRWRNIILPLTLIKNFRLRV